ncbi:MAG: phosphopantetheine-binding protein [Actinomycetota bacterium]|nr:phosphopantetheine-binding protein [Actinomycetota bacterium]
MTDAPSVRQLVADAVSRIAPDVDPGDLDADLHDDLGLDSMDLLNLATAISIASGVEIPERDLPGLRTLRQLQEYLARRLERGPDHDKEVAP